jgi:hypothetical protein
MRYGIDERAAWLDATNERMSWHTAAGVYLIAVAPKHVPSLPTPLMERPGCLSWRAEGVVLARRCTGRW